MPRAKTAEKRRSTALPESLYDRVTAAAERWTPPISMAAMLALAVRRGLESIEAEIASPEMPGPEPEEG